MRRRLFIAINLPAELQRRLAAAVAPLRAFFPDARFIKPENIHITISFLGYQPDDAIPKIVEAIREAARAIESPEIAFTKITYGPPSRGRSALRRGEGAAGKNPRMLWLLGDEATDERLGRVKTNLENEMEARNIRFDREEFRTFRTHATLARFQASKKYQNRDSVILPAFVARFAADSLDLMESHLGRSGAEYTRLASFAVGG